MGGSYLKLSENFTVEEMRCPCCNQCRMDEGFIMALQEIRNNVGRPFVINSAYRCKSHNKKINGKNLSRHTYGMAVDIIIVNWIPEDLHFLLFELTSFDHAFYGTGIGIYKNHIHFDLRKNSVMWIGI